MYVEYKNYKSFSVSLKPVVLLLYCSVTYGFAPNTIKVFATSLCPLKSADSNGLVQNPRTSDPKFGSAPCFRRASTILVYPQWLADKSAVCPFFPL